MLHTPTPWIFAPQDIYVERARLLKQTLLPEEGYFRDNDGSWIISASNGERVAAASFKGAAKRGHAWNAPDAEGFANAQRIVTAVNSFEPMRDALEQIRD